jgi:GxxExxY protein
MRLHFEPGAGLEGTDQVCLQSGLQKADFQSGMQAGLPVFDDGVDLDIGRIDLLVGDWVRIEGKSVEAIFPLHQVVQGLWYLTLGGKSLAQLINSNIVRTGGFCLSFSFGPPW